jgi:hypothetical protein
LNFAKLTRLKVKNYYSLIVKIVNFDRHFTQSNIAFSVKMKKRYYLIFFFFCLPLFVIAQSTLDFRSQTSGNWNTAATWQRFNGTSWVTATAAPNSSDNVITIRNGHTVTISSNLGINQTIVEFGGKLVLAGGTLTILDGLGTDLLITGVYERTSLATNMSYLSTVAVVCATGGTYIHNAAGGSLPSITWQDGSLLQIKNSITSGLDQSFWNVLVEGGTGTRLSSTQITNRTMTVRNNFEQTGGTFYLKTPVSSGERGGNHVLNVRGNILHSGGFFSWNSDNQDNLSITSIMIGGNFTINGTADWSGFVNATSCSSGVFFDGVGAQTFSTILPHLSTTGVVRDRFFYKTSGGPSELHEVYNGTTAQETISGSCGSSAPAGYSRWPTSGTLLKTLTIDNSAGVTLLHGRQVNATLFLKQGLLNNGSYLTMGDLPSTIDRSGGSLSHAVSGTSYNVTYSPHSSGYATGLEIPLGETVLQTLTVNNGNQITLAPEHCLLHVNNNLKIESGNFQVAAGYRVVLTNSFQNTGGTATFENNSSLIQINNGANTGPLTYKRIAQQRLLDYVYWGSPTSEYNVNNYASNGPKYFWNTTILNQNGSQGNWQTASGLLPLGAGVIIRGPSNFNNTSAQNIENTFIGVPNNGTIAVNVQRGSIQSPFFVPSTPSNILVSEFDDNWNLIGNPYPSAISAKKFLQDNQSILTDGVFIWTHGILPNQSYSDPFYQNFVYNYSTNDYIIYNLSGNLSGPSDDYYIGAGQGFMIAMLDGPAQSSEVIFSNSQRNKNYGNATGQQFFRTNNAVSESVEGRFWLDLVKNTTESSRNLIAYVNGASNIRDPLFDAAAKTGNHFQLYSLIDNLKFKIQGRDPNFFVTDKVPLGVKATEGGIYKFALAAVDGFFMNDFAIYLHDKLMGSFTNLKESYYECYLQPGTIEDRFEIVYQQPSLHLDENTIDGILVFRDQNHILHVNGNENDLQEITVFDLLGKTLHHETFSYRTQTYQLELFQQGVIAVRIKSNGKYKTFKLL